MRECVALISYQLGCHSIHRALWRKFGRRSHFVPDSPPDSLCLPPGPCMAAGLASFFLVSVATLASSSPSLSIDSPHTLFLTLGDLCPTFFLTLTHPISQLQSLPQRSLHNLPESNTPVKTSHSPGNCPVKVPNNSYFTLVGI